MVTPSLSTPISYPESSGFLVSGCTLGETLENSKKLNFLIGCSVTASIVLPQKSCGNKIPAPQSLSWRPTAGQRAGDSGYEIVLRRCGADALWARHAFHLTRGRMRDEPEQCLRRRLGQPLQYQWGPSKKRNQNLENFSSTGLKYRILRHYIANRNAKIYSLVNEKQKINRAKIGYLAVKTCTNMHHCFSTRNYVLEQS